MNPKKILALAAVCFSCAISVQAQGRAPVIEIRTPVNSKGEVVYPLTAANAANFEERTIQVTARLSPNKSLAALRNFSPHPMQGDYAFRVQPRGTPPTMSRANLIPTPVKIFSF